MIRLLMAVVAVAFAACGGVMEGLDGGSAGGAGGGSVSGGGVAGGGSAAGGSAAGGSAGGGAAGGAAGGGSAGGGSAGGGSAGGGSAGGGSAGGSAGGGTAALSFGTSVAPLFRAKCSAACHGGAWQGTNTQIYNRLRGTTAGNTACANQPRITVGNGTNSLVVRKLSGTQTCGSRMPLVQMGASTRACTGTECMAASDIALVVQWINEGANNN